MGVSRDLLPHRAKRLSRSNQGGGYRLYGGLVVGANDNIGVAPFQQAYAQELNDEGAVGFRRDPTSCDRAGGTTNQRDSCRGFPLCPSVHEEEVNLADWDRRGVALCFAAVSGGP